MPHLYMATSNNSTLALLSGLSPDWMASFPQSSLAIRQTNPLDSDVSVADTVALMGTHARVAAKSSQVRQALQQAGALQAGLTEDQVIERVFQWIKSNVKFVEDDKQLERMFSRPNGKELLITPPVLLTMDQPQGDCDDFSMLVCSMLMAKGIGCDFITIAANSDSPNEFSHVYTMARTRDGRTIPIDASHGKRAGWEKPNVTRKQLWPVFDWGTRRGNGLPMITKGMGDYWDESGNYVNTSPAPDYIPAGTYASGYPTYQPTYQPPINNGPNIWESILPGIFGSVEKIAIQTTQQPGIQTTGPNGTSSSTVLPTGYSGALNLPSFNAGGGGGLLPIILIGGGIALFALFSRKG